MARMNNMQQMMKQARKMQEQLESVQEGLGNIEVSATAGGGAVKATATADMHLTSLTIDPETLDPDDVELLQDMIVAAVNEVLDAAQAKQAQQMNAITGGLAGLGIPGLG